MAREKCCCKGCNKARLMPDQFFCYEHWARIDESRRKRIIWYLKKQRFDDAKFIADREKFIMETMDYYASMDRSSF